MSDYNYHDYNCPECNEAKLQSDNNARKINEVIDQVNALIQVNNETVDFIEDKANEIVEEVAEIKVNEQIDNIKSSLEKEVNDINTRLDNEVIDVKNDVKIERQRQYSKIRKNNEISCVTPYIFPNTFSLRYDELPTIFTDNFSNFNAIFDVSNYKNIGGKNVYVDIVKGNSSNDGLTENTPCQSLTKALNICEDNDTIIILNNKGTIFYRESWFSNGIINKNINVIALNKIIAVKGDKPTWTKVDGFNNVYMTSRTLTKNVIDLNNKIFKYKKANTVQEVDENYYSWFTDGINVYINSRFKPNEKVIPLIGTQNSINNDNTKNLKLYLENLIIVGGDSCINITGNTSYNQHELYTKNCELYASSSLDCCLVANSKRAYHQNTICAYSSKDGFNYSTNIGDSNIVDFIEVNCKAYLCGDESINNGSYHNGSTAHAKSHGIRINCVYYNNIGGNVIDVAGAKSVNLGCITYDSISTMESYRQGIGSQGNQGLMDCEMWLNGCISFGNLYDIYFTSGSIGHIEKCQYDTILEAGNVYKDERL